MQGGRRVICFVDSMFRRLRRSRPLAWVRNQRLRTHARGRVICFVDSMDVDRGIRSFLIDPLAWNARRSIAALYVSSIQWFVDRRVICFVDSMIRRSRRLIERGDRSIAALYVSSIQWFVDHGYAIKDCVPMQGAALYVSSIQWFVDRSDHYERCPLLLAFDKMGPCMVCCRTQEGEDSDHWITIIFPLHSMQGNRSAPTGSQSNGNDRVRLPASLHSMQGRLAVRSVLGTDR